MSHNHENGDHAHGHSHELKDFGRAFAIGIGLNLSFVVVEILYGIKSHSLALVADGGHNFSDVLGLLLAWWASSLSKKAPTSKRTYGFKSSSILAALFNAVFLLVAVGAIAWEAIRRFWAPANIQGETVIWVALVGIAINTATALLFMSGRKNDLNIKGAFLHMAADAGVSAGVVVAGFVILKTGLLWIDPVVSLIIVAVIVAGTWGLLRDSMNLALAAVPSGIKQEEVKKYLASLPSVIEVHDLHIWGMSTTESALTAHLVRSISTCDDGLLEKASAELHEKFGIEHVTLQYETKGHVCKLAPDDVV